MNYTSHRRRLRREREGHVGLTGPFWRGIETKTALEDNELHKPMIGISEQEKIAAMAEESVAPVKTGEAESSGHMADRVLRRRKYSADYKLRVLAMAETLAAKGGGEVGAFLREEGLYGSHLSQWRKQKADGCLEARKRGRTGLDREVLVKEVLKLRRRLAAAEKRVLLSERLVELQKKSLRIIQEDPEMKCPEPGPP